MNKSSKTEKELALAKAVLESAGPNAFKFHVQKETDAELGVIEIKAVWYAPLDEVLPDEYKMTKEIKIFKTK